MAEENRLVDQLDGNSRDLLQSRAGALALQIGYPELAETMKSLQDIVGLYAPGEMEAIQDDYQTWMKRFQKFGDFVLAAEVAPEAITIRGRYNPVAEQ